MKAGQTIEAETCPFAGPPDVTVRPGTLVQSPPPVRHPLLPTGADEQGRLNHTLRSLFIPPLFSPGSPFSQSLIEPFSSHVNSTCPISLLPPIMLSSLLVKDPYITSDSF